MSDNIRVIPIPALNDNYIWLIYSTVNGKAIAVDPGETKGLLSFLEQENLILTDLLITHHHWDHTNGIKALKDTFPNLKVHGTSRIDEATHVINANENLLLQEFNLSFEILDVAGHTMDHIAFYNAHYGWLFSGDVIFSAGCGRVFEGSYAQAFAALSRIKALPNETKIFPTHEYTEHNLGFAAEVEPDNSAINDYQHEVQQLRAESQASLPTTVLLEKTINPFLRTDSTSVLSYCRSQLNKTQLSELDCFSALRDLRNGY